ATVSHAAKPFSSLCFLRLLPWPLTGWPWPPPWPSPAPSSSSPSAARSPSPSPLAPPPPIGTRLPPGATCGPASPPLGRRETEGRSSSSSSRRRVQFAAEVAEFSCNEPAAAEVENQEEEAAEEERPRAPRGMPANRVALYNGILRDRLMQRMACCY
ncbi:unnamed protein product, partial [Musa textilis]